MENDLSLPPNRPRPKGSNKRLREQAENRPRRAAAPASGGAGIPTGWLLAALSVGLALAYVSTAEASAGPNDTAALPVPTGPATAPAPAPEPVISSSNGPAPATKPARRPIVPPLRPLVFVYIDSFGGEGIFDRLKTADSLVDGHGLDRVSTLANGEFAGTYTGKFWAGTKRPNGTTPTYLQLYAVIDNRHFNYWVDAEEVKQFHAPGAQQHEGWGEGFPMTATTKQLIALWYAGHYA